MMAEWMVTYVIHDDSSAARFVTHQRDVSEAVESATRTLEHMHPGNYTIVKVERLGP